MLVAGIVAVAMLAPDIVGAVSNDAAPVTASPPLALSRPPTVAVVVTPKLLAVKAALSTPAPVIMSDATVVAPALSVPVTLALPPTVREAHDSLPLFAIPAKF